MKRIAEDKERKIICDYFQNGISYMEIAKRYHLSMSGVISIIKRYCGKVYSEYINSDDDYTSFCCKYQFDVNTMKQILTKAERLYHVGFCYSRIHLR